MGLKWIKKLVDFVLFLSFSVSENCHKTCRTMGVFVLSSSRNDVRFEETEKQTFALLLVQWV